MFKLKIGKTTAEETTEPTQESQNSNQSQEEALEKPSKTSSAGDDTVNHFDEFLEEAEANEQEAIQAEIIEKILSREEFNKMFVTGFQMSSHLTNLQSLYVENQDGRARACSDALYDTCLEIPALRGLLMPQNKWLERGFAILAFSVPIGLNVRNEVFTRQQASKKQSTSYSNPQPTEKGEPTAEQASALVGG